jgi:hypothetical protein
MAGPRIYRRLLETTLGLLALAGAATVSTAAGPAAAAGSSTTSAPSPSLVGIWTLNDDLTGRLQEGDRQRNDKEKGAYGHHGGGRRGGESGGSGPPGGVGPGGVAPGDDSDSGPILGDMPFPREEVTRPTFVGLSQLTITQQGKQLTIIDKAGNVRVLTTDGSKVKDPKALGGPTEVQAKWEKDGSLTVQVKPAKGPRRIETYIVSNDRKHLYVVWDIGGDAIHDGLKIRRAYDPAPPPAAPEEKPAPPETPGEADEVA